MNQTPSVGRIVHYMARGSADGVFPPVCRAAIITEVPTDAELGITDAMRNDPETREGLPNQPVSICVLNPTGIFFQEHLDYDEDGAPGTWHWPERVGPAHVTQHSPDHAVIPRPDRTPGR